MTEIITAVYEKGLLRPTEPLNLREHQTVRLQVLGEEPTEQEDVLALLAAAGMLQTQRAIATRPPDPVSPEERQRLAEILGRAPGRSLSQIIIDERGPR
jgi:predicted DNA-binding antitoxin AbrB/MazE fold protein